MNPALSTRVFVSLSAFSSVCGCLVVGLMILLTLHDRKAVDRVTLRLQVGVSALDVWLHVATLYFGKWEFDDMFCIFLGWNRFYFPLAGLFLHISIALNLHLLLLLRVRECKWLETMYWMGSFCLPLLVTLAPAVYGQFGMVKSSGDCLLRENNLVSSVVDVLCKQMWFLATVLYCGIVAVRVGVRFGRDLDTLRDLPIPDSHTSVLRTRQLQRDIKKLILRVALYPAATLLTHSGWCIKQICHYIHSDNDLIDSWAYTGLGTTSYYF
ncbi:hypothetical protein DSO57_1033618 [Entomophthora muscae]|uniref:Uncharacterized protein n=1 Tax=Entomophthora muscae TaxID=34485 RepID=A0ACC2RR21_9FUNG|nr:hypothetical protein DSO57_1033618 [Entomophthora muscae]